MTAEVLDYSFTSAVSDRGHVEGTSLLFAAVESQLSERQAFSELIHGVFVQKCFAVVTASNSPVCCLWYNSGIEDELSVTTWEKRSQPPEKRQS